MQRLSWRKAGPILALSIACGGLLAVALGTILTRVALAGPAAVGAEGHPYTWETSNTGLTNLSVRAMARHPVHTSTLYLETERGAFKSVDNGHNWFLIRSNDPYYSWGVDIAFAPDDPETVYVADTSQGVLKSTNGGATWSQANNGLPNSARTIDIAHTAPYTLYAGYSNQTSIGGGVYRSPDGGENWTLVGFAGVPIHAVAVHPVTPSLDYAGTWSSLAVSHDGGQHWTEFPDIHADVTAFAFDPHAPNVVYAGTWTNVLFKSVDAGQHWVPLAGQTTVELVVDPAPPYPIYAATVGGVLASWDGAESWEDLECPGNYMTAIVLDPERPGGVLAGEHNMGSTQGVYRGARLYRLYLPLLSRTAEASAR